MCLVPGMWDQEYHQAKRERREEEEREEKRKREKRRGREREDIHCNLKRYSSEHLLLVFQIAQLQLLCFNIIKIN